MLTIEKLIQILPGAAQSPMDLGDIVNGINYSPVLNTKNRVAGFIAQCGHESAHFKLVRENLNYSADGLRRVFPKYFPTLDLATEYARKPEKIANRVYAGRMGNGPEASGDGWKYRGRGFIQLTGKANYTQCGKDLGLDLVGKPEMVEGTKAAVATAIWYWQKNNLNKFADADDIKGMTKAINGGYHGLDERTRYYTEAKKVLST
jgi:putative chitinase